MLSWSSTLKHVASDRSHALPIYAKVKRRLGSKNRALPHIVQPQSLTNNSHVFEETDSYNTFLDRARKQKMFVLQRFRGVEKNCHANHDDCPYHEIQLAGTTSNVYKVVITHLPYCNCPNSDFKAQNSGQALCKHVLYVLRFVLKAPEHLCYQNAFLTSELREIDACAPALPDQTVEEKVMDGKRKPVEDDCPICCMEFAKGEEITWCCAACESVMSKSCFAQLT
jgi:hypothetical protein